MTSRDIPDLKGSLQFTQADIDKNFNGLNQKIIEVEIKLNEIKGKTAVTPTWATEVQNKLVVLGDCSRRNNLRIDGIRENKKES